MATKSKLLRMDNVLIVVDDLEAAKAFFAELGMELEGEAPVEGRWVDRVVGLNDVRADIAMMRTPDGHSRVELTKFHTPPAVRAEPEKKSKSTCSKARSMFRSQLKSIMASSGPMHCRIRSSMYRRAGLMASQVYSVIAFKAVAAVTSNLFVGHR